MRTRTVLSGTLVAGVVAAVAANTTMPIAGAHSVATPTPPLVHTVAKGETLTAIARRYSVTVRDLAAANSLRSPDRIRIGSRLTVPAPPRLPRRLRQAPDRLALRPAFARWSAEYGVPRDLLEALAWHESGWQNSIVSYKGAIGIGQLMPATVAFVNGVLLGGAQLDPARPEDNIRMSARFLRYLLDQTGGDEGLALAAYYQGLASVRRAGPGAATKVYVTNVLGGRKLFDPRR